MQRKTISSHVNEIRNIPVNIDPTINIESSLEFIADDDHDDDDEEDVDDDVLENSNADKDTAAETFVVSVTPGTSQQRPFRTASSYLNAIILIKFDSLHRI